MNRKEFLAGAGALMGFAAVRIPAAPKPAGAEAGTTRAASPRRIMLTDLGVIAGADAACTVALQDAIERCHALGGGTVVVPAGRYVTGSVRLRSGVCLELEHGAVLLGSTRLADYPVQPTPAYRSLKDAAGFRALIYAEGEHDIAITGHGTIDGRGGAFAYGGSDLDGRPRLIQFVSCRDVRVEGLRLRDSALWMQHYLDCERVYLRGLNVWNHANHNNDMVDIDGCRGVVVSDCIGDTDDDGITLKSTGPAACEHVAISNCIISSHCNAIKCGTESTGGFRNIVVSNCVIRPSTAEQVLSGNREGISGVSLEVVDGGVLDGVLISNVSIERTLAPLFIRLGNRARKHLASAPDPVVGVLRNVRIENFVARAVGDVGSSITGIPGHPVENIGLHGVRVELAVAGTAASAPGDLLEQETAYPEAKMWGRLPACGFFVRHASGIRFSDVTVAPAVGESRPVIVTDDVVNGVGLDVFPSHPDRYTP